MTAAKRGSFGTRGDKNMENNKDNGTVVYYDKDHRIWHDEYDCIFFNTFNCPVCGGDVEVKDVIHTENEMILMFQCGHCNYRKNFIKEIRDESK